MLVEIIETSEPIQELCIEENIGKIYKQSSTLYFIYKPQKDSSILYSVYYMPTNQLKEAVVDDVSSLKAQIKTLTDLHSLTISNLVKKDIRYAE